MATGFHGFHVMVGTAFLAVCLFRVYKNHMTPDRHFGLEAAAWYWHFVDVVWLFLYVCVYIWGLGNTIYVLYGFIISAFPIIAMSVFVLGMNIYGYLNWVKDS